MVLGEAEHREGKCSRNQCSLLLYMVHLLLRGFLGAWWDTLSLRLALAKAGSSHVAASGHISVWSRAGAPCLSPLTMRRAALILVKIRCSGRDFVRNKKCLSSIAELVKPVLKPSDIIASHHIIFTPNMADCSNTSLQAGWVGLCHPWKALIISLPSDMGREECRQALSRRAPCCPFLWCPEYYSSCSVLCVGSWSGLGHGVVKQIPSVVLATPITSICIHAIEILGGVWKAICTWHLVSDLLSHCCKITLERRVILVTTA